LIDEQGPRVRVDAEHSMVTDRLEFGHGDAMWAEEKATLNEVLHSTLEFGHKRCTQLLLSSPPGFDALDVNLCVVWFDDPGFSLPALEHDVDHVIEVIDERGDLELGTAVPTPTWGAV
jgi:hypothetical protein